MLVTRKEIVKKEIVKKEIVKNAKEIEKGEFKLISWNILAPSLQSKTAKISWRERSKKICNFIEAQSPQIICLSEIDEFTISDVYPYDKKYQTFFFTEKFPLCDYAHFYLPKATSVDPPNIPTRHGNLVIVNKNHFEICSVYNFPMGQKENENQIALCILLCEKRTKEKLILVSVHLKSGNSIDAKNLRDSQIQNILSLIYSIMPSFSYNVIFAGDFNQDNLKFPAESAYSYCYLKANSSLVPCTRTQTNSTIASENKKDSKANNEQLDYVFLLGHSRGNLNLKNLKTFSKEETEKFENENYSDHFPLITDFNFKIQTK